MIKTGIARIYVQGNFCTSCGSYIKRELLKITDVSNVYLRPRNSLVVFNFVRANEISSAMNLLTALGYPPKGEKPSEINKNKSLCFC